MSGFLVWQTISKSNLKKVKMDYYRFKIQEWIADVVVKAEGVIQSQKHFDQERLSRFAEHLSRCEFRKAMEIEGLFGKRHLRNLYERLDDSLRCWALVDDDNAYEVSNFMEQLEEFTSDRL